MSVADIEAILLTHIHLDHAGATGTLLRENPKIRVYVHERGAPHRVDPSRLLRSAARIYGEGAITPAMSGLSAREGVEQIAPTLQS